MKKKEVAMEGRLIEARVAGIPCTVRVDTCTIVGPWKGPASSAPSADDYYGYEEIEFTVCDRRGRPAPWLEKKMSRKDEDEITAKIIREAKGWN